MRSQLLASSQSGEEDGKNNKTGEGGFGIFGFSVLKAPFPPMSLSVAAPSADDKRLKSSQRLKLRVFMTILNMEN